MIGQLRTPNHEPGKRVTLSALATPYKQQPFDTRTHTHPLMAANQ